MRFLVTGCAGFIGSHVTRQLLEAGHEVVGVDSLNDQYDPRLKRWRLAQLQGRPGFAFHLLDISRRGALDPLFAAAPIDAVINLAARAGVAQSLSDPWVYLDTNAHGTVNVMELCRRHDVATMMLASTSSLYGLHNERPYREDADTDQPLSPYAASKKAAEVMAAAYTHLYGLNTPVCRYFTVYGPAGRPAMSLFRFVRWIAEGEPVILHGDGTQSRDFTYVEDIARGTVLATQKVRGHAIINLGSDAPVTMNDAIELIVRAVDRKAKIEHRPLHRADVPASWADITKARTLLGWAPEVSLEAGIRATVAWYLENRAWAKDLELGEV
jgi:nucleoside-diphosphate-sugar epimerase